MNKQTVGTCSICGGQVTIDTIFWSIVPPVPTCERCGATAKQHGPVIEMEKQEQKQAAQGILNKWNL